MVLRRCWGLFLRETFGERERKNVAGGECNGRPVCRFLYVYKNLLPLTEQKTGGALCCKKQAVCA